MKNIKYFLFVFGLLALFASCQTLDKLDDPKDPTIEYSPVYPLCGEWWVTARYNDGTADHEWGYYKLLTFGTTSNTADSMWVADYHTGTAYGNYFWAVKSKTGVNMSNLSFGNAVAKPNSVYTGCDITIANGKVIVNGGKSTSGTVTDSIYFETKFSDDANGFTYKISGVRRTGFLEDEH